MTRDTRGEFEPPSHAAVFSAFLKIGLIGFGGVAALARHVLVVERDLMSERDFAESFGVASTLPGANTVNLATMLGDRWRGITGAIVAVAGLMGPPLVVLIVIMSLYARYSDLPDVRAGVSGAAAAAAGLVIGTSLKLLRALDPDAIELAIFAGVCLAAAVLRAPMLMILVVAIPLSLAFAFARKPAA